MSMTLHLLRCMKYMKPVRCYYYNTACTHLHNTSYYIIKREVHTKPLQNAIDNITLTDMNDDELVKLLIQDVSTPEISVRNGINQCKNGKTELSSSSSSLSSSRKTIEQKIASDNLKGKEAKPMHQKIATDATRASIEEEIESEEKMLEHSTTNNSSSTSSGIGASEIQNKNNLYLDQTLEHANNTEELEHSQQNSILQHTQAQKQENEQNKRLRTTSVTSNFPSSTTVINAANNASYSNENVLPQSTVENVPSSFKPQEAITESHAFNHTYEVFFKIRQNQRRGAVTAAAVTATQNDDFN